MTYTALTDELHHAPVTAPVQRFVCVEDAVVYVAAELVTVLRASVCPQH